MPRYWTGTLNLAKGAAISEGGWIEEAWLYVKEAGGSWIEVNHWVDDPEPGGPMGAALAAAFDSTNFEDDDVVFVRFVVTDVVGGILPTTKESNYGFAAVHNNAFAYQHHDYLPEAPASNGLTRAEFSMWYLGYDSTARNASGWTWQTVKDDSQDAAFLYFNTHGGFLPNEQLPTISTDAGAPPPGGGAYVYAFHSDDVLEWRTEINGTGLPPFNSTGKPITTYVHIDSCWSGSPGHGKFTSWFWPYQNAYFPTPPPPGVIDQAVFGYTGRTWWADRQRMANEYWWRLEAARTIVEMRDALLEACLDYFKETGGEIYVRFDPYPSSLNAIPRSLAMPEDCPVWGDWYTRITGVYTGDTTVAPAYWHRPI